MKSIIISGPSRTGKTTFCKMLLKKYPELNYLSRDIITVANKECKHLAPGITVTKNEIIENLELNIFCNCVEIEPDLLFLLENPFVPLDDVIKDKQSNCLIVVFGYLNIDEEKAIYNIMHNDTEDSWTYVRSVEEIKILFRKSVIISRHNKRLYKKYNIKYVDTLNNREKVFEELIKWVDKHIK